MTVNGADKRKYDGRKKVVEPSFALTAIGFCAFGLFVGVGIYSSARSGFEGWGAMYLGVVVMMGTLPVAAFLGLISLIRKERPLSLSLAAILIPMMVALTFVMDVWSF